MARRNQMGGVSDRHAMLSAYGYGQPPASGISPSFAQQQQQQQRRAPSPFEQPYGSGASTPSSSTPVWGASSSSAPGTSSSSPWHAKKDDDLLPRPGSDAQSSASSASKWWPRSSDSRLAEQLEEGNDERLQGLSDRVKILKGITMGIGNEVREGTKDLDSLQEAMSNAGALLGNTFTKMNNMARRQGGWFCNMMLFILFCCWIFVFLWWWRR